MAELSVKVVTFAAVVAMRLKLPAVVARQISNPVSLLLLSDHVRLILPGSLISVNNSTGRRSGIELSYSCNTTAFRYTKLAEADFVIVNSITPEPFGFNPFS